MRSFAFTLLILTCCFSITHAAESRKPLNVLLIMADDLNNELGCYGSKVVKSPNIDRLAERGVKFDRAYCNYPVCNPSRTSLLSGRRPTSTGVIDNATPTRAAMGDVTMLPEHFRRQGYTTIKVGKIFHTGDEHEDPRSWDEDVRETKAAKNPPKDQLVETKNKNAVVLHADDGDTWDGYVARQAVKRLEKVASGDKPFFVAAGFRRPHTPYISTEKHAALYQSDKMHPQPGSDEHLSHIPKWALTYNFDTPKITGDRAQDVMAAYYASISYMDAQVGVLLEAMDRLKLWDNTIVVFMSDHGYHVGEHGGLWHKMTLFEEAARIPLIVAAPGRRSATSPRLVELVDIYPTLVELAGLPTPDGLEGKSAAPLLDEPNRAWKQAAVTIACRGEGKIAGSAHLDPKMMGRSVRTERYRYTRWHDGSDELYDHDADPHEYKNLADDPALGETKRELVKLLSG
jgi:uncharacterized sulfatase